MVTVEALLSSGDDDGDKNLSAIFFFLSICLNKIVPLNNLQGKNSHWEGHSVFNHRFR